MPQASTKNAAGSIDHLDLADYVKEAAEMLREAFPDLKFTSGRRDTSGQARAMAGNVTKNRQWIAVTYAGSPERDALQRWVDGNSSAIGQTAIAVGLEGVMMSWSDAQRARLSRHFSGEAFDIRPVGGAQGDVVKQAIRSLPNLDRFIENEGGLVIWHAQFKRPAVTS